MAEVRRSAERVRSSHGGVQTRHAFAAGTHWDPDNTSYGLLLAHDEHVLAPGAGFAEHRHQGVEVVTWVLSGELAHRDETGSAGVLAAGQVQVLSAGAGVVHAEHCHGPAPTHLLTAWVACDDDGPATRATAPVDLARADGALAVVASGLPEHAGSGALPLRQGRAALLVARLSPGQQVVLPEAPWLHLHVVTGAAGVTGAGRLRAGDAVRLSGEGGQRVEAAAGDAALVAVWQFTADLRPAPR